MTETLIAPRQSKTFHSEVSRRAHAVHALGRVTLKPLLSYFPLALVPQTAAALAALDLSIQRIPFTKRLQREIVTTPTWSAIMLTPVTPLVSDKVIVYLHGGAFFCGGLGTHRRIFQTLALDNNMQVLAVDYRQYPAASFNESVADCRSAVEHLLNSGYSADQIIVAGDSAGGGLALRVAGDLLADGLKLCGVISLSGWLDFTATRDDYRRWEARDAYIPARRLPAMVKRILGREARVEDSPISALRDDFPPVLLVVGANEILRVDTERAYEACERLDIPCELHYFRGGAHAFPIEPELLPESIQALRLVEAFIASLATHTE